MNDPSRHLDAMRTATPLVQNITNYVAMNVMANVMLAAGASPAMVHARGEVAEFAGLAAALTINIGTLDAEWAECMALAARAAVERDIPWVLDPVAVGATAMRRDVGARLLDLSPTVIRGNASEILALSGAVARGRGADAADEVAMAQRAARDLARASGAVVAVTGPVDFVTDGARTAHISNGDPIMPRITALGCSLTGVVGAFAAATPAFEGTIAALAYYGVAGEIAGRTASGPGSFQPAFLDALYAMTGAELDAMTRVALT
ncbi:hydroxyethylthiazole kinase [Jannaschia donghaensis]|uniref:Hydroxyethylthiazole kinase n=1 Tax=Jannaschia donghaensis TaxID=420998 RepID=A0A0M6YLK8_9RHOB|nr:hydroxyethylthiazole kinase [Jannaschia donghaensis]CTQ51248.1 Hydroxyethylthiazole kinase [Jannaschia donghaensis]